MTRILGIDPGSRFTGFGVLDTHGNKSVWVGSGCIRVNGENLAQKLKIICEGISEILDEYQPELVSIEQVFMHRNADSALKLGQARGAALGMVAVRNLPVAEYAPREIKKAVVGKGNASKEQVQLMVQSLLGLNKLPQADAADALAAALCHAHHQQTLDNISQGILPAGYRRKRWRL